MQAAINNYTDFEGFTALRQQARENTPESIKKVAKQFESLFIQMMLKGMRDTVPEGGLFDNKQQRLYQDMYDKQISINMSDAKGIGLAAVIERQLSGNTLSVPMSDSLDQYRRRPVATAPVQSQSQASVQTRSIDHPYAMADTSKPLQTAWTSAEDFIEDVRPYAEQAALQLGIDPDVLLAQSALETGWGKYTPSYENGQISYSLFGIKADSRWSGKTITVNTLEFRQGAMQKEQAKFRAYDSVGEAFRDYADFIQQHPRYQQALQKGYNPDAYARELQQAGYATDPNYARKIQRIRHSELLQKQTSALKNSASRPLT